MLNYYLAPWKKFAQFSGRARRKEYWWFTLGNAIITYALLGASIAMEMPAMAMASTGFSILTMIPSLAALWRRMHDVGKAGWFGLIPFYNLYLAFCDSKPGTNQYGPNPKADGLDMADHLVS